MAVVVAAGAFGCGRAAEQPKRSQIRLTTGTPGAGFFRLGTALAHEYTRVLGDTDFLVLESEGGASNIEAIERGEADVGLAHANVTYLAFTGRADSSRAPSTRLRGIAKLNLMSVHLLVRRGAPIRQVADLRGRRIGLGVGRGSGPTAAVVLGAFGMKLTEVTIVPVRYNDAPAGLADNLFDAHLVTGSAPLEAVTQATAAGARLLELDGPSAQRLHRDFPFYKLAVIPAGTYPGHARAIHTVGVDSLLICRADLDEAVVYRLTKALFEILPAVSTLELSFGEMNVDQAPATPIPLHPGAARYYRERELSR
jgi:TRAP transporter TAXI family solute receptor